jgi:hypothetical protein
MTNRSTRRAAALGVSLTLCSGFASAADVAGRLMCATVEALDCEAGASCFKGRPSEIGAPAFMRIDLEKMVIAGPSRSTPIVSMEKSVEGLLLQGTEVGYGWTLAVNTREGTMTATLVNREGAFVLFGSCTPF